MNKIIYRAYLHFFNETLRWLCIKKILKKKPTKCDKHKTIVKER